jgi:hypothetical protein
MQNQLQKAINLAKKTGDRLMVFDSQHPDSVYVVMSLDEYEKMAIGRSEVRGLTEDELLDKINRDIAIWKSEQNYSEIPAISETQKDFEPVKNVLNRYDDYLPKISNINEERKEKKGGPWSIPSERKMAAEEIIEEDRQYLEEINF